MFKFIKQFYKHKSITKKEQKPNHKQGEYIRFIRASILSHMVIMFDETCLDKCKIISLLTFTLPKGELSTAYI